MAGLRKATEEEKAAIGGTKRRLRDAVARELAEQVPSTVLIAVLAHTIGQVMCTLPKGADSEVVMDLVQKNIGQGVEDGLDSVMRHLKPQGRA